MWGHALPYECLREVAARAEVGPGMAEEEIRRRLRPYMADLLRQGWQRLAADCRDRGVPVYLVYRPFPFQWTNQDRLDQQDQKERMAKIAQQMSLPFLDLSHAFDSVKYRYELILAPWDDHTNARGQRLLADELFRHMHDAEGHCLLHAKQPANAK
jgi:hypothetical protein